MKTAAGQCCFYTVPERDALGIGRHYAVRTYETLCDDWLVLHKARAGALAGHMCGRSCMRTGWGYLFLSLCNEIFDEPRAGQHKATRHL